MEAEGAELALVMLSELPAVGDRTASRVLDLARQRGVPLWAVLRQPVDALETAWGLPARAVLRLTTSAEALRLHAGRLVRQLRSAGAKVCDQRAPGYPRHWCQRAIPPPPFVFALGNMQLSAAPTLALLHSRALSTVSVTATLGIVETAAADGFVLATGGMKGSHRIAAVAARAVGAARIVVLDRGLFTAFGGDLAHDPFGLGPNRAPLDAARTLALSTFRLEDHAAPRNGRRRDQLLAALGDVIVAVSARPGGEVERICLHALDLGQCVLSWHGENAGLVAAGAIPIGSDDLRRGLRRFAPVATAED